MSSRLLLGLVFLVSLFAVAPAQAAPGALNVLVTGNQSSTAADLATAIAAEPGIASATSFDTSGDTPTAESLTGYDLVVSIGDSSYQDPALWGDRLADFVDAGGAVLQAAYDNWDSSGAAPTGRFESGGYAPLLNGDNANIPVTLGTLVVPDHPIVQGLPAIPTSDNTTTPLAPGATLLAKWSDDRNAIAFKNRVAAISASPGDSSSIPGIARLARNTGNYLGRHSITVAKSGRGRGTVTGSTAGILCGTACSGVFPFGTTIALTAKAEPNSQFRGWTGSCTGKTTCAPVIAGSDLGVEAIFDLATFGKKTRVSISLLSKKVSSNGRVRVRIRNTNSFSVTGSLSGRTASKVMTSRLGYVKLKSKRFSIKAKSRKTVVLKLQNSLQMIVAQQGSLKLRLTAKVKSPARKTRTIRKKVSVKS